MYRVLDVANRSNQRGGRMLSDARVWLTNRGSPWSACGPGDYLVSYELSPGSYDAYIWGSEVRHMTELGTAGCRIVSNLHADTLEQARRQIVDQCGASERGFQAFQIFIPLSLEGFPPPRVPRVEHIDYVEAGQWRQLVRDGADLFEAGFNDSPEREGKIAEFLQFCLADGVLLIEEVRKRWLGWIDRFPVLLP